jgi:antitoxin (DNA-binding transcriptional repressor) of toxin-antitoxin stability system
MHLVDIREAETHLASLLEEVERGEKVVVARAGRPIPTLSAYRPVRRTIAPPGSMKGGDWCMRDDFDAPVDVFFSCFQGPGGEARAPSERNGGQSRVDPLNAAFALVQVEQGDLILRLHTGLQPTRALPDESTG